jgi:hypothetical protein
MFAIGSGRLKMLSVVVSFVIVILLFIFLIIKSYILR